MVFFEVIVVFFTGLVMKKIDDLAKFGMILVAHFPNVRPGDVKALNCKICEDYIKNVCLGKGRTGDRVLDCMLEKYEFFEVVPENIQ